MPDLWTKQKVMAIRGRKIFGELAEALLDEAIYIAETQDALIKAGRQKDWGPSRERGYVALCAAIAVLDHWSEEAAKMPEQGEPPRHFSNPVAVIRMSMLNEIARRRGENV